MPLLPPCYALLLLSLNVAFALDLSVMSYNLYGWNALGQNSWKAENIFSKMRQYAPDIMGCQEVEGHAGWISGSTVDSSKGAFAVVASHAGHAIFYRSSLFDVEAEGHFNINEQDQWGLRRLAWARFRHKSTGQSFLHFNSHWCVCGEGSLFSTARSVAQWMQDVRSLHGGLPAMLTGDFNVFGGCDNSKAIRYLKGETVDGHTSPVVFADAHEGQGATFGGCKIDYVLIAGDWSVSRSLIDRDHRNGAIGSDHDSLYAELVLGGQSPPVVSPTPPPPGGSCEVGGDVWNRNAAGHSCGSRIEWAAANLHQGDMLAARRRVAEEYPSICGSCSDNDQTTTLAPTTPEPVSCSIAGTDRWGPNLGGCCNELTECVEARSADDASYCPASDAQHLSTCWSTIVMCRSECTPPTTPAPTPAPVSCTVADADRWGPNLGGCCSGLEECAEPRSADDSYYCPASNPQHGTSCWSSVLMCRTECRPSTTSLPPVRCPSLQNVEKQCSTDGCKVLATGMTGRTCRQYCTENGFSCKAAWEEQNENCIVKATLTCDEQWPGTSDLICECEPSRRLAFAMRESVLV